jgi:Protein of unknown function (DUF1326)
VSRLDGCAVIVPAYPALLSHIERGSYDGTALDGLNVAVVAHTPGLMAEGNWTVAAYIDERANDQQTTALGAIFTGAVAVFAHLIANNLGEPLPTIHASGEIWTGIGHPVAPNRLALPVGARCEREHPFRDHGIQ